MSKKYAHSHILTEYNDFQPSTLSHSDWTNITDGGLFDCGASNGLAVLVKPKGVSGDSVSGTNPILSVRVDHSVDGLNWAELFTFSEWMGTVEAKIASIPRVEGPTSFAQFVRVMIKVEGTNAAWGGLEVKASLKD